MPAAREGHIDGVKSLSEERDSTERALNAVDKQLTSASSNLIDFLKSNQIPFQTR